MRAGPFAFPSAPWPRGADRARGAAGAAARRLPGGMHVAPAGRSHIDDGV